MAECNPALVADSYVKVFSGNDDLIDEIDPRFVIDINKNFPKEQAAQLKKAIGNTLMQAVRVPTMVGRLMDGGTVSRHAAMQISMAFISAYKLAAGEAVRGPNEPGGITFGFLDDMVQSDRVYPDDPGRAALETVALAAGIYDQVYLGGYMSGGVGFTQYATAAYTDNILEDYVYHGIDTLKDRYGGFCGVKPDDYKKQLKLADEISSYALEMYERYPAVMETHFGGSQRATVTAASTGIITAMATGVADNGLNAWYQSMLQHKERTGRLGFYGFDLQDQCGSANSYAYRSDEGLPMELRGPNYPNYAMNVGHLSGYAGIPKAAHLARGDAFVANPMIKVAFSDKDLVFDFANVTKEFGRGGLREFVPAGERTAVIKG